MIPTHIILVLKGNTLFTPDTSKIPILNEEEALVPLFPTKGKYLCLTICGYRKPRMSEADYRNQMVNVSAPMTKNLMVKYGVKR